MRVFPSFVWVVRDFTLELKLENEPITSDEYLESALTLKSGSSRQTEQYNLPRSCLRHFFAVRKCFVFTRPASTQNMRRMEELTGNDLDSEFLEQENTFCHYIFDSADPKTVSGSRVITGTALGNLAEVYIEAIRSGKIPCLENAVVSLAKIQNVHAVDEALQFYMTEMFSMAQLPLRPEELSDIHTDAEKAAIEVFITMSFNDNEQIYQKGLMEKLNDEYQQICRQNQEESIKQCKAVLLEVFDTLEKCVSDGLYLRPGGYQQYRHTLRYLTSDYRERTHSQIMNEEVLSKFLKEKEDIGNFILQADQSLSEAEQEKEVQSLKNEILAQRQRGLEEQNRLQEQAYKDMRRSHKEHVDQIICQMERAGENEERQ
ncbi:guanylate-binding protein 1-like isoform X2 [Puntigrus tetrazona]|uniref:guanylate-binding protein 1-like isoform X2 n=1 Tax=Puntigrus tetrazona TaxID=1606681 RepID=UPI001C89E9E1|nr:guanylate-binding protein 1-like isoform X2 [Puntigrus tetrazona]